MEFPIDVNENNDIDYMNRKAVDNSNDKLGEIPQNADLSVTDSENTAKELVLVVKELRKQFYNKIAVNNISFKINRGEIFGLLGPNGAGKTTTIKSIMGMIEIDHGKIELLGKDPVVNPKEVKKLIGYVSEEPLLYDSLTPQELFNFIASVRELDDYKATIKIQNLMTSFDANQYYNELIATLSKGNKQKIQIIASLMHDPELLILDEPLSGLDAKSRKIMRNILDIHTSSGKSVLLCTHAMEDAQGLCDRIGIINHGNIIAEGTVEELARLTKSGNKSLEEIFLELTFQNQSVEEATARLEGNYLE